jgi:hypothetical protein
VLERNRSIDVGFDFSTPFATKADEWKTEFFGL